MEILRNDLSIELNDPNEDLLESGMLDSLGLVQLIVEIEEQFNVVLPIDELEFEHFQSVATISALVSQLQEMRA